MIGSALVALADVIDEPGVELTGELRVVDPRSVDVHDLHIRPSRIRTALVDTRTTLVLVGRSGRA